METASHFDEIFNRSIGDYQQKADIDLPCTPPFTGGSLEALLYRKNWIDNVQWDLEDLIRDPEIDPSKGLELKRRIDRSNQERTDMVEQIDDVFESRFREISPKPGARLNTESIAWALDRLSILLLKRYHMQRQSARPDTDEAHRERCSRKLEVLRQQRTDLLRAIDELLEDVASGARLVKVYRQMKMYNDPTLNPVLQASKKQP
jgi:hypothetical protein